MSDQQKKEQYSRVRDQVIRAALDQHGAASDANDFEMEHRIDRILSLLVILVATLKGYRLWRSLTWSASLKFVFR